MSILKVDTIQDQTASNSSTPAQMYHGRATAWVNFNGTGTIAIRDSYNVSSLTDHSAGRYTVTFENAHSNANYCAVGSAGGDANTSGDESTITWSAANYAASSIYVRVVQPVYDPIVVTVAVFGGN